ncbi:MAG: response regulator [Chitinivibrionales bacterium]|nr:response regulator [Chitinivibrionales bacterium]
MITFHTLIPLLPALANLFIFAYIYGQRRKTPVSKAFLLFAFFAFFIGIIHFLLYTPLTPTLETIVKCLITPFFIPLGFLFLNFVFALLGKKPNYLYWFSLALVFGSVILSFFIHPHNDLINLGLEYKGELSFEYILLILFAVEIPGLYALFLCYFFMRKNRGTLFGKQLGLLFIGALLSSFWGIFFVIILPSLFNVPRALHYSSLSILIQIYFIYHAVSKYHLLSANIEQLEQSFSVLFEDIDDAILLLDPRGDVLQANSSACSLFGESKDKITVRLLQERIKGYEFNRQYRNEPFILWKDTTSGHLLLSQTEIATKGRKLGIIMLVRDISEQIKTEQELQKAQNLEALGQLTGGIAHDFNNFLGGITASFSLALMELHDNPEIEEILRQGEKAALDASSLTKQLLAFAKGGMPINESFQIGDIVREACVFAARGSKAKLVFDFPQQELTVKADKGQLTQVFQNLTLNSVQAMPEGGVVRVKIRSRHVQENSVLNLPAGPYVEIMIEDEGEGIPEEFIDKVFEPYFTTKKQACGLGLSMAHSILINHGGSIFVSSESGVGAVFTVYIPEEGMEKQLDQLHKTERATGNERRILVMEDDHVIRNILKKILERFGYKVDAAINGEEALGIYNKRKEGNEQYYVVLADLTIPGGMGGVKLAEELHKIDPDLKIIICSGYAENEEIAQYRKFGFFAAIRKPYSLEKLRAALDSVSE